MNWITWENVGVDRIGCAWLIRRFIDPEATFSFIPAGQTQIPPGEAFDIPGVRLTHRGSHCSFHTMLLEYNLADPILRRIASMIDEADVAQSAVMVEPVAAGLDFICEGLRRISANDDIAVERGRLIYEALYAQLASEKSI